MDKKQALEIARELNFEQPPTCDRCETASKFNFGWAGIEALCMACFIEAILEFDWREDNEFAEALAKAQTLEDLVDLCESFSS